MILQGFKALSLASLFSAILSLGFNFFLIAQSHHWWWSLLFLFLLYLGVNLAYNYRAAQRNSAELLLGTVVAKLLLLFTGVFLYSLYNRPGFFNFCIHFLLHYILFTVFEMRYLLSVVKSKYTQSNP